jgi:hypothetical protein
MSGWDKMTGSSLRSGQASECSVSFVRAAAISVIGVDKARGVPEVVGRRIRADVWVALAGHPVVADLSVVDVREAIDERLHPCGVGVGLPVQLCHVRIPLMEATAEFLPGHATGPA